MLYNLEPDASVTGGAWYSDQDFESEFVDILNQQCHKFLLQKVRENLKLVFFASSFNTFFSQCCFHVHFTY